MRLTRPHGTFSTITIGEGVVVGVWVCVTLIVGEYDLSIVESWDRDGVWVTLGVSLLCSDDEEERELLIVDEGVPERLLLRVGIALCVVEALPEELFERLPDFEPLPVGVREGLLVLVSVTV